jgi:hypothetical protein
LSFFDKIFGSRRKNKFDSSMTPELALRIINAYGAVLEKKAPCPGCVADVSKLPYPKEQIKKALIIGLMTLNDPYMKQQFKNSYIYLADWQEGVGETDQGINLLGMDLNEDFKEMAQKIREQPENYKKWDSIVKEERQELEKELRDLNLW